MTIDILGQSGYIVYNSERYEDSITNLLQKDASTGTEIIKGQNTVNPNTTITDPDKNSIINNVINEDAGVSAARYAVDSVIDETNSTFQSMVGTTLNGIGKLLGSVGGSFGVIIKEVMGALSSTLTYVDGVSETSFGFEQENSWRKFKTEINRYNTTYDAPNPFGNTTVPAYGGLILGTPPTFTPETDPKNRVTLNTFAKDFRFISFTPGMPKYNGGTVEQLIYGKNSYKNQTPDTQQMIKYLAKNGLDSEFTNKDRRYYTFMTKFDEYYAYLETMLNTLWIKLGLASKTGEGYSLMSFFETADGQVDGSLKAAYKSAIGFYLNGTPGVSQSFSNSEMDAGLESDVNSAASDYQKINYITGMGSTSGVQAGVKTAARATSNLVTAGNSINNNIITPIMSGVSGLKDIPKLLMNVANFAASSDVSATVQQFTVTNGMKVKFPNLWGDSTYVKNMNMDFEFISPYGDPLSIFHYVYVPFLALLTFALPRQADQNGFVSPFFVRADIPGLITTDLALISDITITKGGQSNNLWTKDGLPRSIHCSVTLTDLYPYLAMTKRLSFLSANPSYTVFLDNMAGLSTIYNGQDTGDNDKLDELYKDMLNRVTGVNDFAGQGRRIGLHNSYSANVFKQARDGHYNKPTPSVSANIDKRLMPWFVKT